jgi:hypothetical protein
MVELSGKLVYVYIFTWVLFLVNIKKYPVWDKLSTKDEVI